MGELPSRPGTQLPTPRSPSNITIGGRSYSTTDLTRHGRVHSPSANDRRCASSNSGRRQIQPFQLKREGDDLEEGVVIARNHASPSEPASPGPSRTRKTGKVVTFFLQ